MVPKSGTRLLKSQISLTEAQFAALIGTALQDELGASRRATKSIMTWTGVSDHTARAWLNGRTSPSGLHLVALAAHSRLVMATLLRMTGHDGVALAMDLQAIENALLEAIDTVRRLRSQSG